MIEAVNETDPPAITNETQKKKPGRKKKKPVSQKRYVTTVKVFMTAEEKQYLEKKIGDFKSISNYIRHHLGLGLNESGRKKKFTAPAFDLDFSPDV